MEEEKKERTNAFQTIVTSFFLPMRKECGQIRKQTNIAWTIV